MLAIMECSQPTSYLHGIVTGLPSVKFLVAAEALHQVGGRRRWCMVKTRLGHLEKQPFTGGEV